MDKIYLAQTQEGFNKQAEEFLISAGFPVTPQFKQLYATLVQHLPETNDWFVADDMARAIRRVRANEFAYYLMRPERLQPTPEETPDGQETKGAAEALVQEAGPEGV